MSGSAGRLSRAFLGHHHWQPRATPSFGVAEVDAQLPAGRVAWKPSTDFMPFQEEFYEGHPKAQELAWLCVGAVCLFVYGRGPNSLFFFFLFFLFFFFFFFISYIISVALLDFFFLLVRHLRLWGVFGRGFF
jgi:hypothetical protein